MEILSYLESKGWKVRASAGEYQTQCPFCSDTNRYGHLYVNSDHGAFICFRCNEKGSFDTLQRKLGDEPVPRDTPADKYSVWADFVEICQDALLDATDALDYLRHERGFTADTILDYRLGWAPRNWMDIMMSRWTFRDISNAGLTSDNHYPLFWNRVVVPYLQGPNVVNIRAKEIGGNILQPKNTSTRLFGVDQIRGQSEVYLCEGEMDAIYLNQLGFPAAAIPGALSYQEHWNPAFDSARRVFVVLDSDDAGRQGAVRVTELLGKRAQVVELPVPDGEKGVDVTEYFLRDGNTTEDFTRLIDSHRTNRLHTFIQGIRERDELYAQEGVKFGWVDLDIALHPGMLPGQVVTVLARTGVGKTSFVTQLCHNLSGWSTYDGEKKGPGVPVMLLSLEQTRAEIAHRLERIAALHNMAADAREVNAWHVNLRICDENRIPSGDITALVDEFVEDVGESPRVIVVDYLGYWARSFKGSSRYEQTSDAVMELKRYAKELGATIVAPHQVSRMAREGGRVEMDAARDSGIVVETSDFVFSLYRREPKEDEEASSTSDNIRQRARVTLEILKSRHGNVGKQVALAFAPYSLALLPEGGFKYRSIEAEWAMLDQQATYEEVMAFHKGLRAVTW